MKAKLVAPLIAVTLACSSLFSPPAARTQQRAAAPQAGAGGYHALVIGNNEYKSLPKLKTAEADAREIERLLRDDYGFQTKLLINATRQQIVSALFSYRQALGPGANLLVYYAGHGINDKEAEKAYWLPVDATRDDDSNWISADDITTRLRAIPARHVLVIADSCYSGTLTRGIGEALPPPNAREQFIQRMMAGRSRTLMASGGDEPVADGGGGGRHSVFANALLNGLRRMDKPRFTAAELFRYHVEEPVAGRAQQTPEYNPLRNSGHEGGDFVFVRVKTGDKVVEVTVKNPPAAVDPSVFELEFWNAIKNSADPEDFKEYLKKYPNGQFAGIARRRAAGTRATPKVLSLDFNDASGTLEIKAVVGEGTILSSGSLRIESTVGTNLVMPAGLYRVAFFLGPALIQSPAPAGLTCGELAFTDSDSSAVSVTRPGVANNSSTPAWQMQAFNAEGKQVGDAVGEGDIVNGNYLFPTGPQDFTITGPGIRKVRLCSKNHQSTFAAIPIARIKRSL